MNSAPTPPPTFAKLRDVVRLPAQTMCLAYAAARPKSAAALRLQALLAEAYPQLPAAAAVEPHRQASPDHPPATAGLRG